MPVARRLQMIAPADDAPPFDPADVVGLTTWYEADAITGKVDGDTVTTWEDSVASLDLVTGGVGEPTRAPLYKTAANGINSKPVVLFDGTNDYMWTSPATLTLAQPLTLATVIKHTTGAVTGSQGILCASDFTPLFYILNGTPDRWEMYAGASANDVAFGIDANPHILVAIFNGASSQLWVDGAQATLSASPGAGGFSAEIFQVGADNGPADFLNGSIAQFQIISGAISTSDRNGLETAWGSDYGIAVA